MAPPSPAPASVAIATQPRRIALLTSSRFWRGSSNVFAVVGRGLAARGHTAMALVAYDPLVDGFSARHVPVQQLPVGHTTLEGARALRAALQRLRTDIVFVDRPRDIRLAVFASFRRPITVVYCISTPRPPRDLLTRLAFLRVALTVFLTEQLAQRAFAEAPFMRRAQHRVIPNGVDCDLYRPDEEAGRAFRRAHQLGDEPVLLGVGALEIEKRWDLLLDSLAILDSPVPPLLLCGTGALESDLRAQAQRLNLDVRFVGHLDRLDLVAAYNAATCVVHTRPDEVFSLALIEALACGRPVLAAGGGGGGTPELLGDAGVLAPAENPGAFAGLLRDLLADPRRRAALGVAARQRALERYSVERMVREYADVVEELAG